MAQTMRVPLFPEMSTSTIKNYLAVHCRECTIIHGAQQAKLASHFTLSAELPHGPTAPSGSFRKYEILHKLRSIIPHRLRHLILQPAPCPLLGLPLEIRNQIYACLWDKLHQKVSSIAKNPYYRPPRPLATLRLVCTQITYELDSFAAPLFPDLQYDRRYLTRYSRPSCPISTA